jgi:hypothetical protein
MTDTITIPRGEFAAYQNAVERGKAECAQLTMERDQALADRDQALKALDAERVARQRAEEIVRYAEELRIVMRDVETAQTDHQKAQAEAHADYVWRALRTVLERRATVTEPELFPPPPSKDEILQRGLRVVGRLKRLGEDGRP